MPEHRWKQPIDTSPKNKSEFYTEPAVIEVMINVLFLFFLRWVWKNTASLAGVKQREGQRHVEI